MFKPVMVPNFVHKLNSMYVCGVTLNAGALVDIDATDTVAVSASYGTSTLRAGSLKLATIDSTSTVARELGIALVDVTPTGASIIQRVLGLATAYLSIPENLNLAVYTPVAGDIFATSEFVGNLPGEVGSATGAIDVTDTTKYGFPCEVFAGRIRLKQSGNPVRYQYVGKTSASGATVAMFRCV